MIRDINVIRKTVLTKIQKNTTKERKLEEKKSKAVHLSSDTPLTKADFSAICYPIVKIMWHFVIGWN